MNFKELSENELRFIYNRDTKPNAEDWANIYYTEYVKARDAYLSEPNFYNAWYFLSLHPTCWDKHGEHISQYFDGCLETEVAKINPDTRRNEYHDRETCPDFDSTFGCHCELGNTEVEIWLEWGPWMWIEDVEEKYKYQFNEHGGNKSHDPRCDVGGANFEEAIINLAAKVWEEYGDNREHKNDSRRDTTAD